MLQFSVTGVPEPQGSARAFLPKGWSRPVITSDNPDLKAYRKTVAAAAGLAMKISGVTILPDHSAVEVDVIFYFERPKSVSKKFFHKTTNPDTDKLLRAVMDALTQVVYTDDAQVTDCHARKRFGSPARSDIHIRLAPVEDCLPLFQTRPNFEEVASLGY